jgi:hypothetical protein
LIVSIAGEHEILEQNFRITYNIFVLMKTTAAVKHIVPMDSKLISLSLVHNTLPYSPYMVKKMIMDSEAAMNIQPIYFLILNPSFRWPWMYSSGTANKVDALRSCSKMPRNITGSDVKSVLKTVKDVDSNSEVPVYPAHFW